MDSLNHLQSQFQKSIPSKRPASQDFDSSRKKRHVQNSDQDKSKSSEGKKDIPKQLSNHNQNEKERKAKLNRLIMTLKEMVPDCGVKESKNSILEKTCRYLTELKTINQRLLQGKYSEVQTEEMRLKDQKIKELQEKEENNNRKLQNISSNSFEHWSNKAKSLTNKLRNQSIVNYNKKCSLKSSENNTENVDILKSAVMETLPMSPSLLEVVEPVQTTPDSTTNCVTDVNNTSVAGSVPCIVSTSEITPVTASTSTCIAPTTSQTITVNQKLVSEPTSAQKSLNYQKKKSAIKSDQNDNTGLTTTAAAHSSANLVNSHVPILSHEQVLTTSCSSASVNASSPNAVNIVSQPIISNVHTVNSSYCSNAYCSPNATGLVQANNPVIPGIIQPQLSGQNLSCLSTSMLQPQSNTVIFGQSPGVLIGQQMVGNQYAVINQQPFFTNTGQIFPQLNQQMAPTVQPFVQPLPGTNQSLMSAVGPIGQNIMQVDNKNQFTNCTAILLANGQLLPIVSQPSVISTSTTPQDVTPVNNVISSDASQSSKTLFLKTCPSVNQTVNQTAIRETTSTVATVNAPISSQPPNLVSPAKTKRPQRVIKPKPSVTDLNTSSSYTITSQELALSCQMEKLEENDILAKAAESIFSTNVEDLANENEPIIENNVVNKSKMLPITVGIINNDNSSSDNNNSSENEIENNSKKQGEKRKSDSDTENSTPKQSKPLDDWSPSEENSLNPVKDVNIKHVGNKTFKEGLLKANMPSASKVVNASPKTSPVAVSSVVMPQNSLHTSVSKSDHSSSSSNQIISTPSSKRSFEANKTTPLTVGTSPKINAKSKSPHQIVEKSTDVTQISTDGILNDVIISQKSRSSSSNMPAKSILTPGKNTEVNFNKNISSESQKNSSNTNGDRLSKTNLEKKDKSVSKFDLLLTGMSSSNLLHQSKPQTSLPSTTPPTTISKESLSKVVSDLKKPLNPISKKPSKDVKEPPVVSSVEKSRSSNSNVDRLMKSPNYNSNMPPFQAIHNKVDASSCIPCNISSSTTLSTTSCDTLSTVVTSPAVSCSNPPSTVIASPTTATYSAVTLGKTTASITSSTGVTCSNVYSTASTSLNTTTSNSNSTSGNVLASSTTTTYSNTFSAAISSHVTNSHVSVMPNKIDSKIFDQASVDKKQNPPKQSITSAALPREMNLGNVLSKTPPKSAVRKSIEHAEVTKVQPQSINFSPSLSTFVSDGQPIAMTPVTNSTLEFDQINSKSSCNEMLQLPISQNTWKSKPQSFNSQSSASKLCKEPNGPDIPSDHNLPIMCPPTNSAMATAISKTKHLDSSNTLSSKSPTQSVGNSNIDSSKGVSNMFMNMPYTMFHASSSPNDESVQNSHPLTKNTTTKSQENGSTSRPHDKLSMNTTASVRDTISSASGSIVKSAAPQISEEFTSLSYEPPTNTDSALNAALNQVARSNTFSSPTCSFTNGTQSSIAATSTLLAPPTSASHNDISSSVAQTPSSGFLSISQLTANTSCSLSLNEFLTSPTMSEIPSAVVNVNNDSNSANSPFSSIANYFSSSPDPHLPIQSSRVFCESGRNGTSYSASVNKSSNPVCNQGFNSSLSQQPVIDNNFDKQDANVFTPFDQNMGSLPSTRPSAAPLANNNQTTCVNSSNQMPLTNQITNADTNNQNLMNQHNQPTLSSHDPNLKTGDQMNYLNNFCSVDASQNNRSNGMNSQNSSSSSPMVNFHNNVSHPVANLNHSVSPGKQSMNSPAQSHCSASVSQGKNQNNMNKNHHVKESINSGGGSMNCGPIWQPSGDLNFQQPMMPQIIPNMKHNKQISNKDTSGFPCRNWGHEDEFFVNSMGYPLNQSRSPSNYRASSVSLQSPQSTVSPNTTQSTTVRHSPISDINKINQSPKASNVYPSPAGGTQDQNRTYSGQTSQKSNYCLNSGYHRASQSALSSTYSAEALIGDSSRSCSQSLQTSQPFSSVNKNIPHSAESLLPTTSVSNMNTNMPPSTFNFQSINPVVSSHSNSANHFSPGLGLIPRPRFPGFPVPGHNSNHVMNPVGSRSSNLPVEDGISFRWAHPRLPPPPPIPVATSYQSNSRMSAPITNKSPHINSQNKTRTQKPSSTQSLPVTSNQYQFQSYSNQTNQPVAVSNPSSSSKSRSSRNTVAKTSKTKNSSTSKKGKQSASLSSTFQSSSTLEEINLSGSIFEPNRSITPFFGVPNFSPPRTDTPTYLPNNIMNTSHRSQEHNSSTVSTSICNTFTSPLFPPRCQSNLNLNFQQSSGSFGVNTIHPHAVQNQMSIAATSGTPNSITSHFNVSNLLPDPNNSSPSVPSTNLAPIKFHHGNHIAPPSAGSQQSGESLSHPGSTTPHMYNSRTHPSLLHNGMSINSILGSVQNNMHGNNVCSGSSAYESRQANHHMQIGPMAPSLVHPPPGHSGPFNNVLPSLNFSVDDH